MRHRQQMLTGILIATLLAALVAGCGQKGPLRLPDAPTAKPENTATATDPESNDPSSLSSRRMNPHE